MTGTVKIERALMLAHRESGGFMHIEARPVLVIGGDIRNPNGDGFVRETGERELADLVISCQVEREREPYGFKAEYANVFSVNRERAEAMVKQLRVLERGLERLNAERGYAESFGEYLTRVAHVLKSERFLWRMAGRGSLYADNEYRSGDAAAMRSWVTATIAMWQNAEVVA